MERAMMSGKSVVAPSMRMGAVPTTVTQQRHAPYSRSPRVETRLCALQMEQATSSSIWSIQPERFVSIQQPSRDAKLLERAFWHHPVVDVPSTRDEAVVMMDSLQRETEANGISDGTNVVAFTGGNGPALTAYLLDSIFDGSVIGCVGSRAMASQTDREHAAYVCDLLGIDLVEVDDATWSKFQSVGSEADEMCRNLTDATCKDAGMVMFSGFTSDDLSSQGRWSKASDICAPLAHLSHAAVNALSRVVGLPTSYMLAA